MIRKLSKKDETQVLEYLYQEPSINIFIIGDIENYGFDVDFQEIYAEFDNDEIISVLLRYKENVIYYAHNDRFNTDYLELINTFTYSFVSAKDSLMDLLRPHFKDFKYKPMYFCEATHLDPSFTVDYDGVIDVKSIPEIKRVFHLLKGITEFDSMQKQEEEDFIESKLKALHHSVTYSIEEDGVCASTVSTVADTKKSAMVIAVATDPSYRQKGYASKLMIALLDEYINKRNKYLCLFYDNPAAGKIYHRLGFKDIDKWVMLVRED